jgi:hypothetical protein
MQFSHDAVSVGSYLELHLAAQRNNIWCYSIASTLSTDISVFARSLRSLCDARARIYNGHWFSLSPAASGVARFSLWTTVLYILYAVIVKQMHNCIESLICIKPYKNHYARIIKPRIVMKCKTKTVFPTAGCPIVVSTEGASRRKICQPFRSRSDDMRLEPTILPGVNTWHKTTPVRWWQVEIIMEPTTPGSCWSCLILGSKGKRRVIQCAFFIPIITCTLRRRTARRGPSL